MNKLACKWKLPLIVYNDFNSQSMNISSVIEGDMNTVYEQSAVY